MPAFCRVTGTATPTSDSDINFEVWLPATAWNGKFNGDGNGGYGGSLATPYQEMAVGLQREYAVAGTDMGQCQRRELGTQSSRKNCRLGLSSESRHSCECG